MLKLKLLCFLILNIIILTKSQQKKLNILVLYESLCPDSIRFMDQQLGPNVEALSPYVDITLVPFGKSYSENNGANFYCQHGPSECQGNRAQSCVLHQTNNQEIQVKFAVCQMTTSQKLDISKCAQAVGLSPNIDNCMNTVLGTQLQLEAEKITHAYNPKFVPTIIYENIFDQQLQDNSIRNFKGTVCSQLQKYNLIDLQSSICA